MKIFKALFFIVLSMIFSTALEAQQSSKTKAANKLYEKGGEVSLINAENINSRALEFSPAFYQNGIVFASSRFKNGERDKKIDETFFELFYAEVDEEGLPLAPKAFSLRINSHLHEGPVTFNRTGDLMYFTRNYIRKGVQKANSKGQTVLKIYEARKGSKDWKRVRALWFCNDEYSYAHPSLSADGQKLFFASNMPGGFGGMDLYVSERKDNNWTTPINMGKDVNTAKNEVFPFIHGSGNLIFASDGLEGYGELDLYMIDISDRVWGKVTNLGEPFNSPSDDLGLILDPEGTKGYFTSSREGGKGKDDIYMFVAPEGIWGRTRPAIVKPLIAVEDGSNRQMLAGAEIRIFEKQADGYLNKAGNRLYEAVLSPAEGDQQKLSFRNIQNQIRQLGSPDALTDEEGAVQLELKGERQYRILVSKQGYISQTYTYKSVPGEILPLFSLVPVPPALPLEAPETAVAPVAESAAPVADHSTLKEGSVIVLDNIYYDFNKSFIRAGAAEELEELLAVMKRYPGLKIELGSHTDSRGRETYNRQLSVKRAESAKEYLTARGISPDRIRTVGYGESALRNHCKDDVRCSEKEHQYNRRTEVRVLEMDEGLEIEYRKTEPKVIDRKKN